MRCKTCGAPAPPAVPINGVGYFAWPCDYCRTPLTVPTNLSTAARAGFLTIEEARRLEGWGGSDL